MFLHLCVILFTDPHPPGQRPPSPHRDPPYGRVSGTHASGMRSCLSFILSHALACVSGDLRG